jgi:hypothetical protein
MTQDLDSLSLDALFKEARAALHKQRTSTQKTTAPKEEAPSAPAFSNLANWTKTRGVALIHQETLTVIGNFTEYTHKTLPGARRLVRETELLPVTTVEYVTGVWGNPEPVAPTTSPRLWKTDAPATLDIVLQTLRVSAPCVSVEAHFGEGILERVTLAYDTQFCAAPSVGTPSFFLLLTAGTDIFPELSVNTMKTLLTSLDQPV